jgi:hypothetical protein
MKVELIIPTSLSEIPLKHYQDFLKMQKNSNDEEFIAQKMIEIFCGIELKDVVKMKLTTINELIVHFAELFDTKSKFQPTFKIGNQEFGFITNLEDITLGEYVDLESHLNDWETYHKAMAVMYRPVTKNFKGKYEIIDYNPNPDMQELMKFAPLDIVLASSVFFWTLGKELLQATINYLTIQIQTNKDFKATFQNKLNLGSSGDGISQYMDSLKETLQNSMSLPDIDLLNVSPISPLKSRKLKSNKGNLTSI